jgi:dTDP-glucose 4,6-dehydratase
MAELHGKRSIKSVLVTGGCGFIGSAFVRRCVGQEKLRVLNVDCLTYAATKQSLAEVASSNRYQFFKANILNRRALRDIVFGQKPDAIVHFAAESHVDRSIESSAEFVQTNIVGTESLLNVALDYVTACKKSDDFCFLHVSTDEVYGSLRASGSFTERSPYRPNSPYAASKAAADHLARVWHRTYGLPVILTNTCNNYGPFQFPEKLIPLAITHALHGNNIPVYGRGRNVRDWIHVDDHVDALLCVLSNGRMGETYNIGAHERHSNIALVKRICRGLDELMPRSKHAPHARLIEFVADRPGHDLRYAVDASKIGAELGWQPKIAFDAGLMATLEWYINRRDWWGPLLERRYDGTRLGRIENRKGSLKKTEGSVP